jgi:hypothetical protein
MRETDMKHGAALIAFALAAFGVQAQTGPERRFPAVTSTDLNGRAVSLPADFAGPASIVFVAFEMHQQDDVDSWQPFVQKMRQSTPSLGVFELPTISRGYLLMRFIIDNGMRSGISDTATRASTITLYIDVKAFTRDLGLETTKSIAVFVVRPSGEILARASGRYSEEGAATIGAALKPFVEELTRGPKHTADIGQGIHHG